MVFTVSSLKDVTPFSATSTLCSLLLPFLSLSLARNSSHALFPRDLTSLLSSVAQPQLLLPMAPKKVSSSVSLPAC